MMLETPYGPLHFTMEEQRAYPDRFFKWFEENWHVYQAFVELAREGHRKGLRLWGAFAIINVLRWQTALRETNSHFKCNNNYAPGMARMAMRQFPELRGFFKCRDSIGFDESGDGDGAERRDESLRG
jgi:hypothetical protein